MYESPITLIQALTNNFIKEVNEKTEEVIFKAVVNVLPQVDRDELIAALEYDRGQYVKGYKDRDAEIVRCKDCKHNLGETRSGRSILCNYCSHGALIERDKNWFCADGERREE